MKRILLFLCLFVATGRSAAQELTPPKYRGADMQYYMGRLIGESIKIAEEESVAAGDLSLEVVMQGAIDTLGSVGEWQFLDNTCEGGDYRDLPPATVSTREVLIQAATRLGELIPAQRDGHPVPYTLTMKLRVPIQKIAKKQEADPLLFLGEAPVESFAKWARVRIRSTVVAEDARLKEQLDGIIHVRFYIEPDGKITIGEVVKSPGAKITKEVVRVIKNSKGYWTPRKVRGVPQRTAYDYRINLISN